jgi:hypothetical protein
MGSKFRYISIILFFYSLTANSQEIMNFGYIDSLTYSYYKSGDWDKLIKLGSEAVNHGIDYKYLRQRIGYACFSRADYIEARKHFLKALAFDSYDSFTQEYLYYCCLDLGEDEFAGYYAGEMRHDLRKSLSVKQFQPVESIDVEYNFKYAGTNLRSNPQYYHLGINSHLGSRLWLYQNVSNYVQTITIRYPGVKKFVTDKQPEYFVLMKYTLSPHLILKSAYHFLNTSYSITNSDANLGFAGLSADFNRFSFEVNASVMKMDQYNVTQQGVQLGHKSSGFHSFYLTGALSITNQKDGNRLIYNQKTGLKLFNKTWLEGNITFGDLTRFNDHDAIYVYNSVDATVFRSGATLFFYSGKHITIWANGSYERKEYYENNLYHYNQFSYLGGVKWKL